MEKYRNKYKKLVESGRGEWITKWLGGDTSTEPPDPHNSIQYGEYIIGFRRFSNNDEVFFKKEVMLCGLQKRT